MNTNKQSRVLHHIVSPYGLAIVSYAIFLFAWTLPPSIYSHYMKEPDLMFLDPGTFLFYSLCVLTFLLGLWVVGFISPARPTKRRFEIRGSAVLFLLIPCLLGVLSVFAGIVLLIRQVPDIFVLLISQQGGQLKETLAFEVEGRFSLPPIILTGIVWWGYWRFPCLAIDGWRRHLVTATLILSALSVIIFSVLLISRNLIIQLFCGLIVLSIFRKREQRKDGQTYFTRTSALMVLSLPLLFIAFSFLRGTSSWDDQVYSLLGYTVASYNRMAAVVGGSLHYPLGGYGMYLSSVATHTRLLPFSWLTQPPPYVEAWGAEFGAVSQAGLDGGLIWSGAFGYIFSDIGWFSPVFLFGYGLLYGVAWKWINSGRLAGAIFYPCFAFCELFWFGTNFLLDQPTEVFIALFFLLWLYEHAFFQTAP